MFDLLPCKGQDLQQSDKDISQLCTQPGGNLLLGIRFQTDCEILSCEVA